MKAMMRIWIAAVWRSGSSQIENEPRRLSNALSFDQFVVR